jgi:uncharacterized PurR-regulated membrane protein YhhQ (DUF165 family)
MAQGDLRFHGGAVIWAAAYLAAVVGVNWIFGIPWLFVDTLWGPVSLGSVVVGAGFMLRDRAQEAVGKLGVLAAMSVALVISYLLADPFVAIASAWAFGASEFLDFVVYTRLRRRSRRAGMIGSQLVSAAVDTGVFLRCLGTLSLGGFVVMTASKLIALLVLLRRR